MLSQTRAVLLQAKFLSARLSFQRIVVIAALFANEKNGFFLLTLGHDRARRILFRVNSVTLAGILGGAIIAANTIFPQVEMGGSKNLGNGILAV